MGLQQWPFKNLKLQERIVLQNGSQDVPPQEFVERKLNEQAHLEQLRLKQHSLKIELKQLGTAELNGISLAT